MSEHRWRQPFCWGVLIVFDNAAPWDIPDGPSDGVSIRANSTCVAVPVLHAQDIEFPEDAGPDDVLPLAEVEVAVIVGEAVESEVEFATVISCESGRLFLGDAESGQVVAVPPGRVLVALAREPVKHAEQVVLWVVPANHPPAGPS